MNLSLRDSFVVFLFLSKLYGDFHMLCIMQINSCLLNGVAAADFRLMMSIEILCMYNKLCYVLQCFSLRQLIACSE